jgi:PASTA domain
MAVRWQPRLSGSSLNWTSLTATTEGVINGSADVLDSVERDLVVVYQLNGGVESDLSLLWQLDASPITAVESDLSLTWNIVVAAGTSVEVDLELLWQREDPTVEVPVIANVAEHVARSTIQSVGNLTTTVVNLSDNFIAKGDVVSISPPAGTRVLYNAVITMNVSLGWATPEDAGQNRVVYWQAKRKKRTLKQQPNKYLKKMLDDVGKEVLKKAPTLPKPKVKAIKLWE